MIILEEIKSDSAALMLVKDWLGDGESVRKHTAENRASVCVECKFNVAPNWWDHHVKEPIAETIKKELELKSRMKMDTEFDEHLSMCKICGCCNRLKIWAETHDIRDHMPKGQLEKYPVWCWVPSDITAIQ